ncbi:MAG TPA: FGGY family carbohydrate kinase [Anaerolineales bacterium]|nr:FGGY family carbohydrate kinase [Anaerolineales bacterium]
MKEAILGIDIGTSSAKAILFDLAGNEVTSAGQSYPLLTPQAGWVEQDAEEVWRALVRVLQDIVRQAGGYRILSLAIAAQAGSIIPVDLEGNPVYPMITWLDTRSQELTRRWQADGTAATIRKLSGWQPFAGLPLPSISWLRQERPDVHQRARRFLGPADFLVHRLTGRFATDLSASSEMLLVDIKTGQWSEELCRIGGVNPELQSEIGWAGRRLGEISPEASRATGLAAGTPLIAGGNDQPCAGLGMGMTSPGKVMLSTGTAWVIMSVVDADTTRAVPEWVNLYFHAVPERRLGGQLVGGFGATVDWWLNQAFGDAEGQNDPYRHLNAAVSSSPPGSQGLLFLSLSGPSQITNAKPGGGFVGMELVHTRADMCRAILEGCAYEVRWALDELRSAGIPVQELWLAGGANRSPVWPQILADVCGIPLHVSGYADWAALGGAILAGWGIGVYSSLQEGITHLQPRLERLEPNPQLTDLYTRRLEAYRRFSRALSAVHREQ